MANLDRNNKVLLDLVRQPENNECADCGAADPDWASSTLGIFVCVNCSGIHRALPAVSRVKSIRLDRWDDALLQFMQQRGNAAARAQYEKCVPAFYYRPQHTDCIVLKDQWIRAKYERREFTGENNYCQQVYCSDPIEITLWKKGKDNKQFLKRRFVLSRRDFTLKYFIREDSKVPKAVISMKELNAVFQPEKMNHPNGLQISYTTHKHTRNLFVYHDKGQVIVSLFNAIRATRLAYLQKKNPTLRDQHLVPQIMGVCLKEGYMEKTGPTREPFRKRWFTLCSVKRKLLYFKTPLDATELGAVFIGTESHSYWVWEGVGGRSPRGNRWQCGVTLQTPSREFVFMCEQQQEQREWLEAFRKIIAQPMSPEDYAYEANMTRGK